MGRLSSGKTRSEIQNASAKKSRIAKLDEGRTDIRPFVLTHTKDALQELKAKFNVATIGDVIDILVKKETEKLK